MLRFCVLFVCVIFSSDGGSLINCTSSESIYISILICFVSSSLQKAVEKLKVAMHHQPPALSSENCDFLVTYNATNSTHVEFELSGKGDWIAVGFSDDRLMVGCNVSRMNF